MKAARAVVAGTPGLAETLAGDWQKAACCCARFGILEGHLRQGIADDMVRLNREIVAPPLP